MPFDPTDPRYASPLAAMAQDRMSGMLNQPQMKVFADAPQNQGTTSGSPILPGQMQLNRTMGMARGGPVNDELAGIKDTIRAEFAKRGLDFDRFVSNPAVMDEVGKSLQSQGQNGDTILAHINPQEARVLKEMGGSGTINPHTGLPEFQNPGDIAGGGYGSGNIGGGSSPSGGGGGSSPNPGDIAGGGFGSGNIGGGSSTGGGGGGGMAAGRAADRASVPGYAASGGGSGGGISSPQTTLSPLGTGGGSVPMGQTQSQPSEATGSQPSFAGIDPMSGLPIGGASDISGLGYVATAPSLAPSLAPAAGVDTGANQPVLSDINFSDINVGMAPNAVMPGGVSNFAASPIDPGYTDIGVTAMRMAANMPQGAGAGSQSTEYNLGKLGEFDPVAQTQGATILNRMMDAGYAPGFDPVGVGRTMAQQAALQAAAEGNLTAAPGRSFHNFGLAMDVENLPEAGYRDLSRIAGEEGWGWGGSQDPAHVQMAPWGAGAMQTAQRLGAQPFTGATRSIASTTSPLKDALNTVSNIATELFGVKSAKAEEAPQRDFLGEMYRQAEPFGGEEIMSPFVASGVAGMGFPPQSQQQMLDVLGIGGSPVPSAQAAQVLGSGVFPSYEQLGTLPPGQKYQGRAPGAIEQAATATATPSLAGSFPVAAFGYPEQMKTYGAAVGIPEVTPSLLSFDQTGGIPITPAVEQAAEQFPAMDITGLPVGRIGTFNMPTAIQQYRNALNEITVPSGTILGNVTAGPYANNPQSEYYETDAQIAQKILNNLPLAGLTVSPDGRITTQEGGMPTPEQMQKVATLASGAYTVPQSNFPVGSTGTMTLDPREFVGLQNVPMPQARADVLGAEQPAFGAVAPQGTGLSSFEAALTGAAPATTTPPLGGIAPIRAEVPSESTTRMTTEQLKEMGVYKEPLDPGQTVRGNFNEAYGDATARGIEVFEWTNPATGATGLYKSGADDANLPAGNAKPASGEQAPKTDYDRRVAELEAADMIANGMSKEEYAEAMGVPVDQVKTRITTQFGPPMAEYYTKTVLESLAGMTGDTGNMSGALNLMSMFSPLGILGLAAKAGYNAYRNPVKKADGGLINVPTAASPLNNVAPQIALPKINLQKFATPYTGVSPDYKPPAAPPPAAPPPPAPTQDPKDWLKSKFTNWKDMPRSYSAWQDWFKSNLTNAPQNIQDWYGTLPTAKKDFMKSILPIMPDRFGFGDNRDEKNKSNYVAPVFTPRVRTPMPQEYGGYGGEYSYFAQGGVVSPLSAARKR